MERRPTIAIFVRCLSKRIAILGSTGSIGCNAIEVLEHLGPPFHASAPCAGKQFDKLSGQARCLRPAAIGMADDAHAADVRALATSIGAEPYIGAARLSEMVCRDDVDIVLAAVVGAAGRTASSRP